MLCIYLGDERRIAERSCVGVECIGCACRWIEASLDMQMIRDWEKELASFGPSPSMLDLTVAAASADASLRHAVIRYNFYTSC